MSPEAERAGERERERPWYHLPWYCRFALAGVLLSVLCAISPIHGLLWVAPELPLLLLYYACAGSRIGTPEGSRAGLSAEFAPPEPLSPEEFRVITVSSPAANGSTLPATDGGEITCQVCGDAIYGAHVICRECRTPHHEDCWAYVRKCSTFACDGTRSLAAIAPAQRRPSPAPDGCRAPARSLGGAAS